MAKCAAEIKHESVWPGTELIVTRARYLFKEMRGCILIRQGFNYTEKLFTVKMVRRCGTLTARQDLFLEKRSEKLTVSLLFDTRRLGTSNHGREKCVW